MGLYPQPVDLIGEVRAVLTGDLTGKTARAPSRVDDEGVPVHMLFLTSTQVECVV
jgi:hypothetical protein